MDGFSYTSVGIIRSDMASLTEMLRDCAHRRARVAAAAVGFCLSLISVWLVEVWIPIKAC